jgi:hypothetical protein
MRRQKPSRDWVQSKVMITVIGMALGLAMLSYVFTP